MQNHRCIVQTLEKHVESKIQFWSLIGPFCVLLSILFLSLKPDANDLYLPYAALIGIPLCWKWKLRGLAVSLGILAGLVVYHWSSIPPADMLWECGICATFALSFLVTALSYDEAIAPIKSFQANTDAHTAEVNQLRESVQSLQDNLCTYEKLVELARNELLNLTRENEQVKREFIEQRQALERSAEVSLEAAKMDQAQQLKMHLDDMRKSNALLKQTQEKLEQSFTEIQALKATLTSSHQQAQKQIETLEAEKAKLSEEIQHRTQSQERTQRCYEDLHRALAQAEEKLKELQQPPQPEPETGDLPADVRRYEGMYKQLRQQFEEKSQTLDETRRELFQVKEQNEQLKRDMTEQSDFGTSENEKKLEKHILRMEKEFAKREQLLLEEIESLQDLITGLSNG